MPLTPDLEVFRRAKTLSDFRREQEDRALQTQLAQAQIKKAMQLDADALGEQAFLKAAQGMELSPQELAAAQLMDAKSGGVSFNPVTGEMMQKPRISERIGLPGGMQSSGGLTPSPAPTGNPAVTIPYDQIQPIDESQLNDFMGQAAAPMPQGGLGNIDDNTAPALKEPGYYERLYQEQLAAAQGNPKLEQQIKTDYLKSKMSMDQNQSNAALFADRMRNSNAVLSQKSMSAAGKDPGQIARSKVPLVGNYLVSEDFQRADQAKRDFINATLRRESGAAISDNEFANANAQYFPQPGDSEAVIRQKAANRQAAVEGISRAAGPAYEPTDIKIPEKPKSLYDKSKAEFDAKKAAKGAKSFNSVQEAEAAGLPAGTKVIINGRVGTIQ